MIFLKIKQQLISYLVLLSFAFGIDSPLSTESQITVLSGGYSGDTILKIIGKDEPILARIFSQTTDSESREKQIKIAQAASGSGVCSELLGILPQNLGYYTRFINGTTPPTGDNLTDANLRTLANTLKKFHHCTDLDIKTPTPLAVLKESLSRSDIDSSSIYRDLINSLDISEENSVIGFTHQDLHPLNIIYDSNFWLIDLEMAAVGDVYYDLAQIANTFCMNAKQIKIFMEAYFGDLPINYSHFNAMRKVTYLTYFLWGLEQSKDAADRLSAKEMETWLRENQDFDAQTYLLDIHTGRTKLETSHDKQIYGLANGLQALKIDLS